MATCLRDLRRLTLLDTYKNVDSFLKIANNDLRRAIVADPNVDAFDESIKLIIIDKAQLHEELTKCIFSLHKGIVRRAVRCQWFFKSTPNAFFIENVFPVVSLSTRLKVITALSKYVEEKRVNELYDFVRSHYGFRIAESLLARCPKDRVRQIILVEKRIVKPSTFLVVCHRFPDVATEAVKLWLGQRWTVPSCVTKQLSRCCPHFIHAFTVDELDELNLHMGRKLFRSMMKCNKNVIMGFGWKAKGFVKNEVPFLRYFTQEAQVQTLTELVKGNSRPRGHLTSETWKDSLPSIRSQTQSLSNPHKELLLQEVFRRIFNADLWKTPTAFSTSLLEMVSASKRSEMLNDPACQGDDYIYLHPPVVAIPKLISIIKHTSGSSDRAKLVEQMIESCKLTWDMEQLEAVCAFTEENIKEDDTALLRVVERILIRFACPHLSRPVWSFLSRMTSLLISEGHCQASLLASHEGMMGHCLAFGEDENPIFQTWIKDLALVLHSAWLNNGILQKPNFPSSKKLLLLLDPFLQTVAKSIECGHEYKAINGFLDSAALIRLKLFTLPDRGESLVNLLLKYDCGYWDFAKAYRQRLFMFPSLLKRFALDSFLLRDIFKTAPHVVIENLSIVLSEIFLVKGYFRCWKNIDIFLNTRKLLDFYKLPTVISAEYLKAFSETTDEDSLNCILHVYSYVATMSDFEQLAKPFLSTESKLDTSDPKSIVIRNVPIMLRNIRPLEHAIPFILPCLVGGGDLLYQALPAFLKFCYNYPIAKVAEVLIPFFDSPVSIKKKVVRILADICSIDDSLRHFMNLWHRTTHYSARIILLNCIARCFIENPTHDSWECLRVCILDSDKLTLESLPQVSSIPDLFLASFVETMWSALSQIDSTNVVTNAKSQILDQTLPRIDLVEEQFCRKAVAQYLFTDCSSVNVFTAQYLLKGRGTLSAKLTFISTIFKQKVDKEAKYVITFVKEFCACRLEANFYVVYEEFMKLFGKHFDSPKFLEARLLLKYVELCENAKKESSHSDENRLLAKIGPSIAAYWLTMPDHALLIPFFIDSVAEFFKNYLHIESVLARILRDDAAVAMVVLQALPKGAWYDPLVVRAPPNIESIELSDNTDSHSNYCVQYILSFADKLPYLTVQQILYFVLSQCRKTTEHNLYSLY